MKLFKKARVEDIPVKIEYNKESHFEDYKEIIEDKLYDTSRATLVYEYDDFLFGGDFRHCYLYKGKNNRWFEYSFRFNEATYKVHTRIISPLDETQAKNILSNNVNIYLQVFDDWKEA